MSKYRFAPAFSHNLGSHTFVSWNHALSPDECKQVIDIGQAKQLQDANVQSGNDQSIRRSKVSWLGHHDVPWLYHRLEWVAQQLNGKFYQFDLWGFDEDMQFTLYEGTDQGFYNWHLDMYNDVKNGIDQRRPRKLSMTIQLDDPSTYEGGDLLIHNGTEQVAPKDLGQAVVFPSYVLHKVTPVTKGIRRSLVVWITGPQFH